MGLHCWLHLVRYRIEDVPQLVIPAPVLGALGAHQGQRTPEAEVPVSDRQFGRPRACAVSSRVAPRPSHPSPGRPGKAPARAPPPRRSLFLRSSRATMSLKNALEEALNLATVGLQHLLERGAPPGLAPTLKRSSPSGGGFEEVVTPFRCFHTFVTRAGYLLRSTSSEGHYLSGGSRVRLPAPTAHPVAR